MKTSDVSTNRPVQSGADQPAQKEKKGKTERRFDEVLQQTSPHSVMKKPKGLLPTPKSTTSKKQEPVGHEKKEASGHEQVLKSRQEREPAPHVKEKKEEQREAPQAPPQGLLMGPSTVQHQAATEKVGQRPSLDIKDLESIVQRVQVGVNEKGLPEFQFELKTKALGDLDLKVTAENDQVKIQLTTQDAVAQEAFQENLQELSRLLQERGLNLAEVNVMTRDQRQQQEEEQQSQQQAFEDTETPGSKPKVKRQPPRSDKDYMA